MGRKETQAKRDAALRAWGTYPREHPFSLNGEGGEGFADLNISQPRHWFDGVMRKMDPGPGARDDFSVQRRRPSRTATWVVGSG
jgi:hypothetical protein